MSTFLHVYRQTVAGHLYRGFFYPEWLMSVNLTLLPKPRRMQNLPGFFSPRAEGRIVYPGSAALLTAACKLQESVWENCRKQWQLWAGSAVGDPQCQAVISLGEMPLQGYRLRIEPESIQIVAGSPEGVFYAVTTLTQILSQSKDKVPACDIEDFPDFPHRGVMLDVSRDKVPTLSTLTALVDKLSSWKINHIELYTEHTFAYRNHPDVWAQASPITGEDILRLDRHCKDRFVELVPNQNSFGHLQRWLAMPRYRHLAECPDGFVDPWGMTRGPFGIDPTQPASVAWLSELYAELLPHFTSDKFNVGCDETFDLGQGKSKAMCAQKGKGRVYLEFLLKIYELARSHGRTMHFWGDIILHYPDLIADLPRDLVALVWGYEADHPFERQCSSFAQSHIPFYVCPGTSSWLSIAGRTDNCLQNLRNAAANGLEYGATGFLNTDWGDGGHWQYLPVSYLGFAAGAALSWCYEQNREEDFVSSLDLHAFGDANCVMGRLAYDLGNAYRKLPELPNSSILFHMVSRPDLATLSREIDEPMLREAEDYVEQTAAPLHTSRMAVPDASLIDAEFANAVRMQLHGIRRVKARIAHREDAETGKTLAREMRVIMGEHRRLWSARNRPGGLHDSTRVMEKRLEEYETLSSRGCL